MNTLRFDPSRDHEVGLPAAVNSSRALGSYAMTQESESTPTADQIERTLTAVRAAYEALRHIPSDQGAITALVQTAKGTAALHDLRQEINRLNTLLPFKG